MEHCLGGSKQEWEIINSRYRAHIMKCNATISIKNVIYTVGKQIQWNISIQKIIYSI